MVVLSLPFLLAGMVAIYLYPYQPLNVPLFYISKMLSSVGIGMATAAVIGVVASLGGQNKIVSLAPAFIIMFGTEVGIELLEIVFQSSKLAGLDINSAYEVVFAVQILTVVLAIGMMLHWMTYKRASPGLPPAALPGGAAG
jgi:hypothetical protein